jgi:leader peptidase (prepilin peptidase)/N-methyltransferase
VQRPRCSGRPADARIPVPSTLRPTRLRRVLTQLAMLLAALGAGWGFVADRIGARWPAHEDGHVRPIDWRTPVAVATGAVALGALDLRFPEPATALAFGAYLAALVLLLATDLDQRLLPDVITLPAMPYALATVLAGVNPFVSTADLPLAVVVAIAVPALLGVISIPFGAGAIGMGDLKLLVSVGLLAGPLRLVTGVVYGALLAGLVIVVLLAVRRITLRTYIPFGPFLILGALWAILVVR